MKMKLLRNYFLQTCQSKGEVVKPYLTFRSSLLWKEIEIWKEYKAKKSTFITSPNSAYQVYHFEKNLGNQGLDKIGFLNFRMQSH